MSTYEPVVYDRPSVLPKSYSCHKCEAHGVKLWRQYQTFKPKLLCAQCACKDQDAQFDRMDENGTFPAGFEGGRTDSIGLYVPCIPDEEGAGYWGYAAFPKAGVAWWRQLPLRVGK